MGILKIMGIALLSGIVGYALGVPISIWAVNTFSTNSHDKSIEAAMTAFFVWGPCIAVLAAIAGVVIYWQIFAAKS